MKLRLFLLIAVLAAFSVFTAEVVVEHGYLGFIELAMAGGWGAQVFLDLCIALLLFVGWMLRDARSHGIVTWPYVIAIFTTGSIGALAYLIHRTVKQEGHGASTPSTAIPKSAAQRSM